MAETLAGLVLTIAGAIIALLIVGAILLHGGIAVASLVFRIGEAFNQRADRKAARR